MNERVLHTLEYDKILGILETHVASELGRTEVQFLRPVSDKVAAEQLLKQTSEAESVYRRTGKTPIESFPDIREMLKRVHAAHSLSASELLQTAQCLKACRHAREVLHDGDAEGLLAMLANRLPSHRSIEEEIARCIISEDEIADNASPALARIRRQMRLTNDRMREKLNNMIKSPTYQKYLQEPIITVRNGRYALPVKAEHRAQIPGLIHDASGSGATLFIEPAAAVELGNEYRRLQSEEQTEIGRILAGLTSLVDPIANELLTGLAVMAKLDCIFAKAILARDMRAVCPEMNDEGRVRIVRGRHPLLPRDTVIPVDVWLGEEFSTLIITGPNTGGKTVTLKTVGLLSLMAMSGMFVPADLGTRLSVFDEVFADIGDEQSIEQSLSTFSSHMTNTVHILAQADERSLVLLDELGAGTDPIEGAALAQAILEALYHQGARTMATTHYSEIKAFALTRKGMQNASMEFDVDKLCPTYRLYIGIPGKSNAFEISERLGLRSDIIERSREFLQKKDVAFEDVIAGAEEARREAQQARDLALQDRYEAERIRGALEKEKKKLEEEKTKLRQQAKEDARKVVRETREEMETLIKNLRAVASIDQKALERAIQAARDSARKTEERLMEEVNKRTEDGDALTSVEIGQTVRVLSIGREATVLKKPDSKGDVLIQTGVVKMKVALSDLRPVAEKKQKPKTGGTKVVLHDAARSFLELDLRGKMVDEACMEVDRFIDDASLSGINEISVIHGKGTGALRAGIQSFLRTHPRVKSYRIGAYGEGDAGVTVVTLK